MGKLSAIAVKNLKEPGRYSDGEGLILKLAAQGRGSGVLRVQAEARNADDFIADTIALEEGLAVERGQSLGNFGLPCRAEGGLIEWFPAVLGQLLGGQVSTLRGAHQFVARGSAVSPYRVQVSECQRQQCRGELTFPRD